MGSAQPWRLGLAGERGARVAPENRNIRNHREQTSATAIAIRRLQREKRGATVQVTDSINF